MNHEKSQEADEALERGECDRAAALAKELLLDDPANPLAASLLRLSHERERLDFFRDLVALHPESNAAKLWLVITLRWQNRYRQTIAAATRFLASLDPDSTEAKRIHRARLYCSLQSGDLQYVVEDFRATWPVDDDLSPRVLRRGRGLALRTLVEVGNPDALEGLRAIADTGLLNEQELRVIECKLTELELLQPLVER